MSKKIILFVVEGINDEISFDRAIKNLCKNKNLKPDRIEFKKTNGDITRKQNIKKEVGDAVNKYIKEYSLKKTDIYCVIQLVDTDGAFIAPENIIKHEQDILYTDDNIFFNKVDRLRKENENKALSLDILCSTDTICHEINYRIYYFSCNLEHVLHNKRNISKEEKNSLANKFENEYENNVDGLHMSGRFYIASRKRLVHPQKGVDKRIWMWYNGIKKKRNNPDGKKERNRFTGVLS
jgi:hypothetical protein